MYWTCTSRRGSVSNFLEAWEWRLESVTKLSKCYVCVSLNEHDAPSPVQTTINLLPTCKWVIENKRFCQCLPNNLRWVFILFR